MTVEAASMVPSTSESAARLQASLLQLVDKALASSADGQGLPSDRYALLADSMPVFSQLRAVSRRAHDESRIGKRKVAEARLEVDDRSLALQNLKYQKRHLEEEITMCRDFKSIYQTIPLTDLDDFKARAPSEGLTDGVFEDSHALQLARLRFELSERQRLEAEKQAVQAERGTLIKENKTKKQLLEELERDLKEMLSKSDAIWQRFEGPKSESESAAVSQSADTPQAGEGT